MSTPNSPQLQTFRNVQGAAKLAYICEADTAVRIDNSAVGSVLGNFGRVVSYAVPLIPSGSTPCVTGFTAFSGNVACRQAGYDKGRGSPSSTREESGGRAPRIIVGADCSGTGSRAAGLQGSSAGSHTMSITMSEAGGSTRVTVGNLTHHNTFKPEVYVLAMWYAEPFLEDCPSSLVGGAIPFSETACNDPHVPLVVRPA
jgi:hypothetical protein